jgi:hypothetical protein
MQTTRAKCVNTCRKCTPVSDQNKGSDISLSNWGKPQVKALILAESPYHQHNIQPQNHFSMDEDGIALVLARASELRSKITNCIHNSSVNSTSDNKQDEDEEEDDESLLNIRDSFEALESQLSSLQVCYTIL